MVIRDCTASASTAMAPKSSRASEATSSAASSTRSRGGARFQCVRRLRSARRCPTTPGGATNRRRLSTATCSGPASSCPRSPLLPAGSGDIAQCRRRRMPHRTLRRSIVADLRHQATQDEHHPPRPPYRDISPGAPRGARPLRDRRRGSGVARRRRHPRCPRPRARAGRSSPPAVPGSHRRRS